LVIMTSFFFFTHPFPSFSRCLTLVRVWYDVVRSRSLHCRRCKPEFTSPRSTRAFSSFLQRFLCFSLSPSSFCPSSPFFPLTKPRDRLDLQLQRILTGLKVFFISPRVRCPLNYFFGQVNFFFQSFAFNEKIHATFFFSSPPHPR
jgi:hypothetical protein